jgi:hypothetical protein
MIASQTSVRLHLPSPQQIKWEHHFPPQHHHAYTLPPIAEHICSTTRTSFLSPPTPTITPSRCPPPTTPSLEAKHRLHVLIQMFEGEHCLEGTRCVCETLPLFTLSPFASSLFHFPHLLIPSPLFLSMIPSLRLLVRRTMTLYPRYPPFFLLLFFCFGCWFDHCFQMFEDEHLLEGTRCGSASRFRTI